MRGIFALSGALLLLSSAATSWAVPSGRIPEDEKDNMISALKSIRIMADQEARDCFTEGEADSGKLLGRVSTQAMSVNIDLRARGYTYEKLQQKIVKLLQPLNVELTASTDQLSCEPSKVQAALSDFMASYLQVW
jgi:hypothetical protein